MKGIKNYVFNHRCLFSVIIIGLGIGSELLALIFLNNNLFTKEQSKIEIISYLSQIVSSFFVISGVVIAGWQYFITSKFEITKIEIDQVQKAIDLSEFYKDNILEPFLAVRYVYEKTDIIEVINSVNSRDIHEFDVVEMNQLFSKEKLDKLKKIQNSEEFLLAVIEANEIYGLELNIQIEPIEIVKDGKESTISQIDCQSVSVCFMSSIVTNMLNNLEYFAMHFLHKTADDTVVYQSLHKTYIDIINTLYYNISVNNKPMESSYFTNVIELYKIWKEKSDTQLRELVESTRRVSKKGTIIETIK